MSSDLLAEFDSFYRAPSEDSKNTTSASDDLSFLAEEKKNAQRDGSKGLSQWDSFSPQPKAPAWSSVVMPAIGTVAEHNPTSDDIWGSFEVDTESNSIQTSSKQMISERKAINNTSKRESGTLRGPTVDMFSQNTAKPPYSPVRREISKLTPQAPAKQMDASRSTSDILFDAMDEISPEIEDEDEFGDFEDGTLTGHPQISLQPQPGELFFDSSVVSPHLMMSPSNLSFVSIGSPAGGLPIHHATKSTSSQEQNPLSMLNPLTKRCTEFSEKIQSLSDPSVTAQPAISQSSLSMNSSAPQAQEEESWGDFEDIPQGNSSSTTLEPALVGDTEDRQWEAGDKVSNGRSSQDLGPPANVPPPSILLTLFPSLFNLLQTNLLQTLSKQSFNTKNRILSDPATVSFLRAYLLIATVAARIIAGRKHRWKRDVILSQSVKIGPAATGSKGGMKLTGVDKAEIAKEDREVSDVIQLWKEQLGRLRSIIAAANTCIRDTASHLIIPVIGESMVVQIQNGAMTAPKACVVCGLKRGERLKAVDFEVEDTFGEWWVEHWGHRACRNFWLEHEAKLKHH